MESVKVLSVADYEDIAVAFIDMSSGLSSGFCEIWDELEKIMVQFSFIADDPDFLLFPEDTLVFVENPELIIESIVKGFGDSLTWVGLFGVVVNFLSQVLLETIVQSFRSRLKSIADGYDEVICIAKDLLISLYVLRVFTMIFIDYWEEFKELNSLSDGVDFSGMHSLLFPVLERYVQIAYVAGQFFAVTLVRHYLDESLMV